MAYSNKPDLRSGSPLNTEQNEWQVWGAPIGSESPKTEYPTLARIHDLANPCNMPEPGPTPFVNDAPSHMIESGWIEVSTLTSGSNQTSPGWFPPPHMYNCHACPDANLAYTASFTGRNPHLVGYPHSTLSFGHEGQYTAPMALDARPFHLGMLPSPNFQSGPLFSPPFPHFPGSYNSPPEFGSYYLAPPPESFAFSNGFSTSAPTNVHYVPPLQVHPLLPIPILHKPPPNHYMTPHIHSPTNPDSYSRHHTTGVVSCSYPIIPNPGIGHHLLPPSQEPIIHGPSLASMPQSYSSPHTSAPPIVQFQSNVATDSGSSASIEDGSNIQQLQNETSSNIQNIPRSLLSSVTPIAVIVSSPNAKRPPAASSITPLMQRGYRKPRRSCIPTECSVFMNAFRTNREKEWEFTEILGHVVEFSNDQHGSRFIQLKLETITDEEKEAAFTEIHPNYTEELIQNVFGNYVIQKFLEYGTTVQKEAITEVVERRARDFSLHIYGCRVVQKVIDCILLPHQRTIIELLGQDILTCIKDPHGNHVIQKLVQVVAPASLTFLSLISENILNLATHSYGCRVLQRCLEYVSPDYLEDVLRSIHRYTFELMRDQYGNYVIQFIIQHGRTSDRNLIISKIVNNLVDLSQHKYASNVCEKALVHADSEGRSKLIHELLVPPTEVSNPVVTMIKDQYANYVLQRSLLVVEGDQREALHAHVKPVVVALRQSAAQNGRRLGPLLSIERLVNDHHETQQSDLR